MEADRGTMWSGIERHEVNDWMLAQLGEEPQGEPGEMPPAEMVPPARTAPQPVFSEKMRHLLAKTQQSTGTAVQSPAIQAAQPVFTDKLQQLVTRAEQMIREGIPPVSDRETSQPLAAQTQGSDVKEGSNDQSAPAVSKVLITQIQVVQPPDVGAPLILGCAGHPSSGLIKSGEPFALKAVFEVSGSVEAAKKPTPCHAQFYARNLTTGEAMHLGNVHVDALDLGKPTNEVRLPGTTLQAGTYRLQVVMQIEGVPVLGYLELPLLQVV